MSNDFKRAVRHRMARTGEKYTVAMHALKADRAEYLAERGRVRASKAEIDEWIADQREGQ